MGYVAGLSSRAPEGSSSQAREESLAQRVFETIALEVSRLPGESNHWALPVYVPCTVARQSCQCLCQSAVNSRR